LPTSIVYVGPFIDGVELADGQIARPGEPVEVEADLAESYLAQSVFEKARKVRQSGGEG
jgi:hypothetical protein